MASLKIGALARRVGVTPPTIRYYEEIRLLPRANRYHGGQRNYGDEDVRRLTFIRRCRDFGFSISEIRSLLALAQDRQRSCLDARDLAHAHWVRVRTKLRELEALERSIANLVADCETRCPHGPGTECTVLRDLGTTGQSVSFTDRSQ
jgi:MerR family transcriptional regulator, copper efflux regulator